MKNVDRVYLDMCSLKGPFDDQRQARVRAEAAAVAAILAQAEADEIVLVRSPAHLVENEANPREDHRLATALWIDGAALEVGLDSDVEARAGELFGLGSGRSTHSISHLQSEPALAGSSPVMTSW
jgi:hypothetical protein